MNYVNKITKSFTLCIVIMCEVGLATYCRLFFLFRCWPMLNMFTENGTSMKYEPSFLACISCKMWELRSLWPIEVSIVGTK